MIPIILQILIISQLSKYTYLCIVMFSLFVVFVNKSDPQICSDPQCPRSFSTTIAIGTLVW